MSDFIKTLGESNQEALAIKFPDEKGYICSNLLCEVVLSRNLEMLLCSNMAEHLKHHHI